MFVTHWSQSVNFSIDFTDVTLANEDLTDVTLVSEVTYEHDDPDDPDYPYDHKNIDINKNIENL